jgi:flagellar biosynthesis/type III secretory pathway M-ring protein FliF/YscJ
VEYALAIVVFGLGVAFVVIRPLLRPAEREAPDQARRDALEAAKEAKYREIRDAELDHEMGKLSDADFRATDRELRAQAIEILRQLDELGPGGAGASTDAAPAPARESGPPRR